MKRLNKAYPRMREIGRTLLKRHFELQASYRVDI